MSLRRAAPGPQLSSGRIRVDAAKAIAKLREYQLADRNAWVLEAIRAAVAANATAIKLAADANDVWLSWEGAAWPDEQLPRLFDELVSPEAATATHHVRLLAAAVNSALGMSPAYVDVIAIREGAASRVRYTPEILVEPTSALGESALRHVAVSAIAPPDDTRPGMLVHLRRRLTDWRILSEAPELTLARDACRDIAVPLHIEDLVLHRNAQADVVRIALGEDIDGFIAVTGAERAKWQAPLEVAERGVVLVEYPLELLDGPSRASVPIRVYVDAPRMPTNASRSQVRRDAFPIDAAERRAHKLLPQLIGELAKAVQGGSERARESAIALLSSVAGGGQWHVNVPSIRGPLRELAQLPLVRNAVGQPRSLTSHWRSEVHIGAKPFDAELEPWLGDVLWSPPHDPVQLIAGYVVDTRGTRRLARHARRQLRAQKQFYAHTKREVRVLSSATPQVRAPLGVEVPHSSIAQDLFANLSGEVCIYREGTAGALAVLLEGRLLDRIEFDSPLSFDVVVDSANVTPGERYRGIKRDAAYKRVERAMRAGMVRALEAHALAKRDPDDAEIDAQLFRKGFGVIQELGLPIRGPLASAPVYAKRDGTWLSLADLAKEKVIGFVAPGTRATVPEGRVIIELTESDRAQLEKLIEAHCVPYRRVVATTAAETVSATVVTRGGGALLVREPGLVAALTPTSHAKLRLFHVRAELADRKYLWHWLPCTIAIDCDAIVPDADWATIVDDAGLFERDFAGLELALVRAIARALIGEHPTELVTSSNVALDGRLGSALCETIVRHDPAQLFDSQLLAKLRTTPLMQVLGSTDRMSILHVAERFPGAIPFIEQDSLPVAGFTPLVAPEHVAKAMAKLVVREAVDGTATLESYRRKAVREQRLEWHRARPVRELAVPSEDHVAVEGAVARGVVGIHEAVFEIQVHVENRLFTIVHPPDMELPLIAVVELDAARCDDTFEGVPDEVRRMIALDVRAAIPALVVEIAKHHPHQLGDVGSARMLLAGVWKCDEPTRKLLAAVPAFHTIQGGRISIEQAAQPRMILSVAAWQGDWLGPGDGEPPHALDAPILFVIDPLHEVSRIIDKLHTGAVVDVSDDVGRLQSRRRIARGLVPMPRVASAPADLKRALIDLGDVGKRLGVGEIALVEDSTSLVMIYEDGLQKRTESLDVMPAIALAVELAEPQAVLEPAQQLARFLVQEVLATVAANDLPPRIQRNLMSAGLSRRLDRDVLMPLPLWRDFVDQLDKFGDVWVVTEPTDHKPLDDNRRVFMFERSTLERARQFNWNVIEASKELQLDAAARINRARKPAKSLELKDRDGVLAEVTLDGDGVTTPRGTVAVLAPNAARWRGTWPHRKMHPFDRVDDPCRWPTLAMIDDARLQPDRTWSQPTQNADWQAICKELRTASEQALATIGEVPEEALASLRINNHACADVAALRKSPKSLIRGVLWLIGEPMRNIAIQVASHLFVRSFTPGSGLAIGGKLMVFTPDDLDVDKALEQLCEQVHGKLVRQLVKSEHVDADLVAAHVAHALAVRTLRATDVRALEFSCFSPRPLDARALTSLLRRDDPVDLIKDAPPNPLPDVIELVDDGSVLVQTLIKDLGSRVRRHRPAPRPRPVVETPEPVTRPRVATPPPKPPKPAKPEPPHPLKPLVVALRSRLSDLGIGGYRWSIIERAEPMFSYGGEVEVAGDNVRLRALAAWLHAKSPFVSAGIDVVVAHIVTVLNVELSEITDASEAHALGVLLANRRSAGQPQSHRSS